MLQLGGTVAAPMLSLPWLEYVARKLNVANVLSDSVGRNVCRSKSVWSESE